MDRIKLQHLRAAALAGRLPEGLTQKDIEEYSEDLLKDFETLAPLQGPAEARRCLRYQLLALKRAEGSIPVEPVRVLIRLAEEEGLLSVD